MKRNDEIQVKRTGYDYTDEHRDSMIEFRNSSEIDKVDPVWRELLNGYIESLANDLKTVGNRKLVHFKAHHHKTVMSKL